MMLAETASTYVDQGRYTETADSRVRKAKGPNPGKAYK